MINFRYHLVSLTAVFLALAIGLVLGTAALNGPAVDFLNDRVNSLAKENDGYRENLDQLRDQVESEEDFARQIAPTALAGKLTDQSILIVTVSGASEDDVLGAREMLGYTGATITGELGITDNFTDPANNDELLELSTELLPTSVANLPNNSVGVETASALLTAVLMTATPNVTAAEQKKVLAGFTEAQMITGKENFKGDRATAVLIVTGKPYADADAEARNNKVVTTAAQFDGGGTAVLTCPGIGGQGNVVTAVRNDPALNASMSTVDNISTPQGQLAAALALSYDLAGHVGDYGTGTGAESTVPMPPA
ncbi:copper transporter [Phytomonospora sp. NPDC050363]|uniref:copper transporter n=1 Tax=Phytomonospora sp. NPDC050363 TaxID=3155642 RepID=UPI0033C06C32